MDEQTEKLYNYYAEKYLWQIDRNSVILLNDETRWVRKKILVRVKRPADHTILLIHGLSYVALDEEEYQRMIASQLPPLN